VQVEKFSIGSEADESGQSDNRDSTVFVGIDFEHHTTTLKSAGFKEIGVRCKKTIVENTVVNSIYFFAINKVECILLSW